MSRYYSPAAYDEAPPLIEECGGGGGGGIAAGMKEGGGAGEGLPLFVASSSSSHPSFSKGKVLPLVASLARRLLPAVSRRLAMIGGVDGGPVKDNSCEGNFKTTGLESCAEDNVSNAEEGDFDPECGGGYRHESTMKRPPLEIDLGGADPMVHLPHSAAMLVSALESTVGDEASLSLSASSSYADLNLLEMEAEALLNSMLSPRGGVGDSSGDGKEGGVTASLDSINNRTTASPSFNYYDDDNSTDNSINDDLQRLNQSIDRLQRDMRGIERRESLIIDREVRTRRNFSTSSVFGQWVSRGSVVEQKLVNSFTAGEIDERRRSITDNPTLLWSVALLWSFVILLVGHVHIETWVENASSGGGGDGNLASMADFVEWLFYDSFHE